MTEGESVTVFHLRGEGSTMQVDDLVARLERLPDIQVWVLGDATIRVGRIPNVFKAIPTSQISYANGWLTIKLHEQTSLANHIYVVTPAENRSVVARELEALCSVVPGWRLVVEGDTA